MLNSEELKREHLESKAKHETSGLLLCCVSSPFSGSGPGFLSGCMRGGCLAPDVTVPPGTAPKPESLQGTYGPISGWVDKKKDIQLLGDGILTHD